MKVDAPILFTGETVFRRVVREMIHTFILLVPGVSEHQSFTVELGWSSRGRFPDISMRPSVMLAPSDPLPLERPEGVTRLGNVGRRFRFGSVACSGLKSATQRTAWLCR